MFWIGTNGLITGLVILKWKLDHLQGLYIREEIHTIREQIGAREITQKATAHALYAGTPGLFLGTAYSLKQPLTTKPELIPRHAHTVWPNPSPKNKQLRFNQQILNHAKKETSVRLH